MDAIRAFIAIELPEQIRGQLDDVEKRIQAAAGEPARKAVRWVSTSSIHLTLKFLGEVSAANLQSMARSLQAQALHHSGFDFTVSGLGAFPNIRRPRVIWVGTDAPPALNALQKAIDAETHSLGYPSEDRPFSAHLTLGRIAQNANPEEVRQVAHVLGEIKVGTLGTVHVDRVHLFHSDLRPTGAVYTSLYAFPLKA